MSWWCGTWWWAQGGQKKSSQCRPEDAKMWTGTVVCHTRVWDMISNVEVCVWMWKCVLEGFTRKSEHRVGVWQVYKKGLTDCGVTEYVFLCRDVSSVLLCVCALEAAAKLHQCNKLKTRSSWLHTMISQPFLWLIHVMNTVNVCPQWIRHWAWIYVYELITRMQQLYTISWATLLTHIKRRWEGKGAGSRRRQAARETRANKDREERRASEEKDFKSRPQIKAMFASRHTPLSERRGKGVATV